MKVDEAKLKVIAYGCTFLGGGGGGSLRSALRFIENEWHGSDAVELVPPDEATGRAAVCSLIGGQSAGAALDTRTAIGALERAVRSLMEKEGDIDSLVPADLGVQSAVIPCFLVARRLRKSVIDVDGAARAVPDLSATRFARKNPGRVFLADWLDFAATIGPPSAPGLGVTRAMFQRALELCAQTSTGILGMALWSSDAVDLVDIGIEGSLTRAEKAGRVFVDEAGEPTKHSDEVEELLLARETLLFRGTVMSKSTLGGDRRDLGVISVGSNKALVTAGEGILAYDTDARKTLAEYPDAICTVARRDDHLIPVTNVDIAVRDLVTVFRATADSKLKEGLAELAAIEIKLRTRLAFGLPLDKPETDRRRTNVLEQFRRTAEEDRKTG